MKMAEAKTEGYGPISYSFWSGNFRGAWPCIAPWHNIIRAQMVFKPKRGIERPILDTKQQEIFQILNLQATVFGQGSRARKSERKGLGKEEQTDSSSGEDEPDQHASVSSIFTLSIFLMSLSDLNAKG